MGPSDYQLHLTINPNYLRDFFYDVSGQMGCPMHDGAAQRFGSETPSVKKNQLYLRVKSVQLHVGYVTSLVSTPLLRTANGASSWASFLTLRFLSSSPAAHDNTSAAVR